MVTSSGCPGWFSSASRRASGGNQEGKQRDIVESFGWPRLPRGATYTSLDRGDIANQAVPLLAELRHGEAPYHYVLDAGLLHDEEALLEQPVDRLAALPADAVEPAWPCRPD